MLCYLCVNVPAPKTRPGGSGALVEYSIVAENAVIEENAHVGNDPASMSNAYDDWGIAVVGEKVRIGKNAAVAAKAMVDKDVKEAK